MFWNTPKLMDEDRGDDGLDGGAGGGDDVGKTDDELLAESNAAAEAEAKAAKAKEDEDAEADKARAIPKARFDEAVRKEREARAAAETKLKELEARLKSQDASVDAEATEAKIVDLEDKIDAAVADGNKTEAARLRKEVRALMQSVATAEATRQAAYATALAVERVQYAATVSSLEAQHPEMNPDHEDYDQERTDELLELKAAYEATGMGSTDALKKAAKYVFVTASPKKEEKPEQTEDEKKAAAEKAAKAKEDAIRRGAETRGKQPAAATGKLPPRDGGKALDPMKMTDKEFNALPDDERARLRGDIL